MDLMNVSTKTFKMSEACNENLQSVDFNATNWNCLTSKAFLGCYFEHSKEIEEEMDDVIRSKPKDEKELTCSTEVYQRFMPIIMENAWHEQLCKCHICYKMYQDHNVDFLFGILNIECFPLEMLLMIFKRLTPSDRRIASECCNRFLEIWLCDDFGDDRHRLVFDRCVLDPEREPLSVFLKSKRTYRHLVFGDVRIRGESVFAGKFGENITTVELTETESYDHVNAMLSLLSTFPNLKTIKVAGISLLGDYSNVPTTIELLVISDLGWTGNGDELIYLKCYLDRTCDSFRIELNVNISLSDILSFKDSQRNKLQRLHLKLEANDNTFKLPRFDNLKYLELDFDSYDYGTENVLDNLEEQCPALKDLSIDIRYRIPHKNWPFLEILWARFIPKEEITRIIIFENLKELTLETSDDCFFVHESFLNKNLKKLNIGSPDKGECFTCFQAITKSFPNLESLTCDFQVTNVHLEELATNRPKLKYLDLERVDRSVSFASLPNLTELYVFTDLTPQMIETWPIMLHLRKCCFYFPDYLSLNFKTAQIFERMPALEDLTFSCDFIDGDQLALFETLTKPLKRLTKIQFHCRQILPDIYPEIIDVMANNCKYLRQIEFVHDGFREILEQILQKHSSIQCINGVWLE